MQERQDRVTEKITEGQAAACGCKIVCRQPSSAPFFHASFKLCPLHESAPKLLAIVEDIARTECRHGYAFKWCFHREASAILDKLKPEWRAE